MMIWLPHVDILYLYLTENTIYTIHLYIYIWRCTGCCNAFRSIASVTSLHRTRRWFMRSYRVKTSGKRERTRRATRFLNATVGFIAAPGLYFVRLHSSYYSGPSAEKNKQTNNNPQTLRIFRRGRRHIYVSSYSCVCVGIHINITNVISPRRERLYSWGGGRVTE